MISLWIMVLIKDLSSHKNTEKLKTKEVKYIEKQMFVKSLIISYHISQ